MRTAALLLSILLLASPVLAQSRVLATQNNLASRMAALHDWLLDTNALLELQVAPTAQQIADFDAGVVKAMRWDTNNQKLVDALTGPVECADGIKTSCEFLGYEVASNSWVASPAKCVGLCTNGVRITIVPVPE